MNGRWLDFFSRWGNGGVFFFVRPTFSSTYSPFTTGKVHVLRFASRILVFCPAGGLLFNLSHRPVKKINNDRQATIEVDQALR